MRRFVETELDYHTAGDRGIGRITSAMPRFGGRYRGDLSFLPTSKLNELRDSFIRIIICGYLFTDLMATKGGQNNAPPTKDQQESPERFFKRWIPSIYTGTVDAYERRITERAHLGDLPKYRSIKHVWLTSCFESASRVLQEAGIPVDDYFVSLVHDYFDAGTTCRLVELMGPRLDEAPTVQPASTKEPQSKKRIDYAVSVAVTALLAALVVANLRNDDTTENKAKRFDYTYRPNVSTHYVPTYERRDGTVVRGHLRTEADDSFWNNFSSAGNKNPYTGTIGTKTPSHHPASSEHSSRE